ncbi:hypothetical protein [Clostridium mediterraneense]|uniref:hypothetical protein n=1 Tax=Clostridium mediterraneense TaxID=1805472 RepID=UPI001A9A6E4B|nr:hypothetical protein [Clostridium mediterraneense]
MFFLFYLFNPKLVYNTYGNKIEVRKINNNNDTNKESSSNILLSSKAKYLAQIKEID